MNLVASRSVICCILIDPIVFRIDDNFQFKIEALLVRMRVLVLVRMLVAIHHYLSRVILLF